MASCPISPERGSDGESLSHSDISAAVPARPRGSGGVVSRREESAGAVLSRREARESAGAVLLRREALGAAGAVLSRREALGAAGRWLGVASLTAVTGSGLAGLSGCGLRLERSAPALPLLPSARPYPGAAALRGELMRCREAEAAARAWSAPAGPALARTLADLHAEHVAALVTRLESVSEAVPEAPSAGSSTSTPSGPSAPPTPSAPSTPSTPAAPSAPSTPASAATPSPTSAPSTASADAARRRLLAAESAGLDDLATLAAAPAIDRPLLGACHVARAQAARLLGARALGAPRRPAAASVEQAVEVLGTVRQVVYGLEVAAARVVVAGSPRAQVARDSLAAAQRQRQFLEQQAGDRAPAGPPGYDLGAPVVTPADADALARRVLTALTDAHVRALAADDSTPNAPALPEPVAASLLAWARESEWYRGAWGAGPRAVPWS